MPCLLGGFPKLSLHRWVFWTFVRFKHLAVRQLPNGRRSSLQPNSAQFCSYCRAPRRHVLTTFAGGMANAEPHVSNRGAGFMTTPRKPISSWSHPISGRHRCSWSLARRHLSPKAAEHAHEELWHGRLQRLDQRKETSRSRRVRLFLWLLVLPCILRLQNHI